MWFLKPQTPFDVNHSTTFWLCSSDLTARYLGGGDKLYNHNAGMELFSTKLRQMASCSVIFMYVMYRALGCC